MYAGIDFGSSTIKAFWKKDGHDRYGGSANAIDLADTCRRMREDGVQMVRSTGTGRGTVDLSGFEVYRSVGSAIDDEIALQAAGARRLMGESCPKKFILASVGTGVSYTKVSGVKAKRHPLGSAHGGGTILGLGKIVGAKDFAELAKAAAQGTPCDLQVKDRLPETAGTPIGELVIAHFAKEASSFEDRCASVFNFAACSIIKDLAVLTSIPFSPKALVVIGKVGTSAVFQSYLRRWAPLLKGCTLYIPDGGEYAAAIGAYHAIAA